MSPRPQRKATRRTAGSPRGATPGGGLKFVFRVGRDREERPAAEMAPEVAKILRERGHQVRIVKVPKNRQHQHLTERERLTRAQIDRFLEESTNLTQNLHEIGGEDEHVIDWHNSTHRAFFPSERYGIHEYPLTVYDWIPTSPISLNLKHGSTDQRIVASLELPAIRDVRSPTRAEEEMLERLRRDHGRHHFEINEYVGHALESYPTSKARKAGLMSPQFTERIAHELEGAAREPHKLQTVPEDLERELSIAKHMRGSPSHASEDAESDIRGRLRESRQESERFNKGEYARRIAEIERLPFEETQSQLAELNRRRAELQGRVEETEDELRSLGKMQEECRRLGITPQEILERYGHHPHFYPKPE